MVRRIILKLLSSKSLFLRKLKNLVWTQRLSQTSFQTLLRRLKSSWTSFIKTDAEVAAQLATEMTLEWNDFNESIYRRCVEDLVNVGLAVTKRDNDPNYGITEKYVDPISFIHSFTEDPQHE